MRVGGRLLALPVEHVIETMRPLPIEPGEPDAPACVLGVARVRGERLRVVDAARLFALPAVAATRFVIVRAGDTRLALQVDSVLDIRDLGTGASIDPPRDLAALVAPLREARWIEEP
jgi:purine-binding chemotaxis protein CheW